MPSKVKKEHKDIKKKSRAAQIIGGILGMLTEGGSQNLGQPKVW